MNASARRFEIGPVLLVLGALLLFASLFAEWFEPGLTAWNAFEWLDLLLAVIALLVIVAALGLLLPGRALLDADAVPLLAAAPLAIVAVQLLDPPPFVAGGNPSTGAWLALGGCLLMGAGAVLSFGRMRLSISFEGRDPRHRVSAVDARGAGASAPAAGGDGGEGPFDQGAAGRGRAASTAAKAPAGPGGAPRGGASGSSATGAPAPARPVSRERPAWSRPDSGGRRPGGASGATRAEPGGDPVGDPPGPSGDAFDPPLDAPAPPAAAMAPDSAGARAPAGPPPEAAPAGAAPGDPQARPPGAAAPGSGEGLVEPGPGTGIPPAGTPAPASESPKRSGGLFGSWFDEPSRRDDDEDAAGGPGGTRPAGS